MDTPNRAPAAWTAPQCPFTVECSLLVLDSIRLAVIDAFFSLPRGGVEIGGILLGSHGPGRVTIEEYLPLDCEHAFGPSFTLSSNDHSKLQQLAGNASPNTVVGWFHSHTRSEIFLSPADLELHRRFFPEPWQVALVVRPRTMGPTEAGFFFYEKDGSIHSEASYAGFTLEQPPLRVPSVVPSVQVAAPAVPPPAAEAAAPAIPAVPHVSAPPPAVSLPAAEIPAPAPAPPEIREPLPPAPVTVFDLPAPSFAVQPAPSRWWIAVIAILAGLGLGAAGYQTRDQWMPQLRAFTAGTLWSSQAASVSFSALDSGGQLQLRWDRTSAMIRSATAAELRITDGIGPLQSIQLDTAHLQSGSFTYARQSGSVDAALILHLPDGRSVKEIAAFLGPPPAPRSNEATQELADQAGQLQKQAEENKKLERTVEELRKEVEAERKRRLGNQSPESVRK